ncbi:MAG: hypothetical protein ACI9BF_000896 [Candidatus Paceibacteria bacterium]|jgi:hypothetical protein
MYEKLKSFIADEAFFTSLLIILVASVSFGLGRNSVMESGQNSNNTSQVGVIFSESLDFQPDIGHIKSTDKVQIVASKSGAKYHLLSCPGASRIKEENKLFFNSITLAKAAGYKPAANCPGL